MAKEKNDKKSLLETRQELDKKIAQLSIPCSHTKKNGSELNVTPVKGSIYKCRECGTEFSIDIVPQEQLLAGIDMIRSAINQTKALSTDVKNDKKFIEKLGQLDYNLKEFGQVYTQLDIKKKKDKKKDKKGNNIGSYGTRSLFFNK